jgi:hypothetical protein
MPEPLDFPSLCERLYRVLQKTDASTRGLADALRQTDRLVAQSEALLRIECRAPPPPPDPRLH